MSDYSRDRKVVFDTDRGRREIELSAGVAQALVSGPFDWNAQYDRVLNLDHPGNATLVGFADDVALVVVAADSTALQTTANESLKLVRAAMAYRFLELDIPKCEAIVATRRRVYRTPTFLIDGQDIPNRNAVKNLGVWLDDARSYKRHVQETALKAEKTGTALQRLMPNIGGPRPQRRELLNTVSLSIMLYSAAI